MWINLLKGELEKIKDKLVTCTEINEKNKEEFIENHQPMNVLDEEKTMSAEDNLKMVEEIISQESLTNTTLVEELPKEK